MELGDYIKLRDKVSPLVPDAYLTVQRFCKEEKKSGEPIFGLVAYTKDIKWSGAIDCNGGDFSSEGYANRVAKMFNYALAKAVWFLVF